MRAPAVTKKAAEAAWFVGTLWPSTGGGGLPCSLGRGLRRLGVFLAKLLDPAGAVDDLLAAGVERMASGADLDVQVLAERRARLEGTPARAGDGDLFVVRVNLGFHG